MQSPTTVIDLSVALLAGFLVLGGAPAHADADPTTLKMRPRHASKLVAQPAAQEPPPGEADPAPPPSPVMPPPPPLPSVEAAADVNESELMRLADRPSGDEVIIVTGSSIGRKTLSTPAPVTIIDRELLLAAGRTNLGDILQQLPGQTNGANAQINTGGNGSTRIDLRGLGTARTLTLINGRRVVASGLGADVSVDFDTLPLAIIDRVEVLKDGASAVYGSDAIGGVVNVITRNDFDGNEATIYTGGTAHRDGFVYDASFVTGHNSENHKGNIVFAAGLSRQQAVMTADRTFSIQEQTFDYTTRTARPAGSTVSPAGLINTRAIDLNGDGIPDPVDLCGPSVQFCANASGGGFRPFLPSDIYNSQTDTYLLTPSSRFHVFSTGSYKLHPLISTFFEASYLNRQSNQQLAPETFINAAPISKASMYNPTGGTVFAYQRRLDELGPRTSAETVGTFRLVGGVKGTIPDEVAALGKFKWELSYDYGRSDGESRTGGAAARSRLAAALGPSFRAPDGTPTCGSQLAPIPGCVPMNILGPSGSIDQAAAAYVGFTGLSSGFSEQQTVLAQTHGRLVSLPNDGDISLAIGGDFRKESGALTPDPLTVSGDTTGFAIAPTAGSYNVFEAFGELSVIPISGQQFPEWVELDLAARAFRYDTFGTGVTWKAGGLFRIINGFALRGSYSTAFRAPTISELYLGRASFFAPLLDPCDTRPRGETVAIAPGVAMECANRGVPADAAFGTGETSATRLEGGGNSRLGAETAKVLTAGIVFEPPQVKGLSITADYWRTEISNAIQAIAPAVVLARCYERHIESACEQVVRSPLLGGAIDHIEIPISNVGGTNASGIDATAAFDHKLGAAGRLRGQIDAQYLLKIDVDDSVQILHGVGNYDFGAHPRIKAGLTTLWQHPTGIGAGVNVHYVGQYHECDQNNCNSGSPARTVSPWYKVDLFGTGAFKAATGTTTVTVGVDNLLDRDPPAVYSSLFGNFDPTAYDARGRFFYARMSQRF
jgi:iron complex outermembrane receptor protein